MSARCGVRAVTVVNGTVAVVVKKRKFELVQSDSAKDLWSARAERKMALCMFLLTYSFIGTSFGGRWKSGLKAK